MVSQRFCVESKDKQLDLNKSQITLRIEFQIWQILLSTPADLWQWVISSSAFTYPVQTNPSLCIGPSPWSRSGSASGTPLCSSRPAVQSKNTASPYRSAPQAAGWWTPAQTCEDKVNGRDFFHKKKRRKEMTVGFIKRCWITWQRTDLPVSNGHVALVFEGHLSEANLIAGVAVSFPTLSDKQQKDLCIYHEINLTALPHLHLLTVAT